MIVLLTFVVIVISVLLYILSTRKHNYWKVRGVKYEDASPLVGSIWRVFRQKVSLSQYLAELYEKYPKEKFVGYFGGNAISLLIRDPELVKHVLVTDFQHFYPRALNTHKTVIEPMLKNLFFADGDLWKLLRQRMTPAFTSGKLKAMFPLIVERTERLQRIAAAAAERGAEVDVRDLMARYTTDFIGACGFGMDTDSINDDTSQFRDLGKRIFTPTLKGAINSFLKWTFPETFKHLHITAPDVTRDTIDLVKSIMKERNYKPAGRNDFIDLLFELKAKGVIVGESLEKRNPDGTPQTVELELDDMLMAAQVFVFFAAGFETSSSATSFTLHQLALNPQAQKKCQQEIDEVLARYDGKLCYDAVKEMKYLHMCFKEGMRMFPSLGFLIRQCVRPYTFPGTDVTIDGGVYVLVSVQGLHNDEKYFKDPDQFRPERFGEGAPFIPNHVYLPFGEGPRACIDDAIGDNGNHHATDSRQVQERILWLFNMVYHGLHNDMRYFKDFQFWPERIEEAFNEPCLPFREGPGPCLGERLGLMQSLAGLAALLRQCSVAPSAGTRAPRVDPASFVVQNIHGGLPLSLIPRKISYHN